MLSNNSNINMKEKESTPGCCVTCAILTAFLGLVSAPFCWILRDGLLEAYPSYGLGALSHFWWSFLWGAWPTATLLLILKASQSRKVRGICLGLLGVCVSIFLIEPVYAKAYINYADTPFTKGKEIMLWQQGIGRIHHWPSDEYDRDSDKIWQDWEFAHNSTHCWRSSRESIAHPLVRCELSHATITWGEKDVEITNRAGTFTRPRNDEDERLLHHLKNELNKKAGD